ncbi:MAG: response regulator [Anaerolineae bacterium]|nr:response regulator [Anaerolineae bacterium]
MMSENAQVLIVDDDPGARATLEALLFKEGYDLAFAENGVEALEKAADLIPDAILLDVMMPGMDGFEVCQHLRADPVLAEIPVIMITALDDRESRLEGIQAGANDFVSQPYDRAELRARVRTITWLNRQRRLHARELQMEQDRTQAILDALGEAVIVTDLADNIQYVNPAATTLTGFTRDRLLGQTWHLWQNNQRPVDFYAQVAGTTAGQPWRGEVTNQRANGTLYDVQLTIAPLFDSQAPDRPIGFVSVQRDITALKNAERVLTRFVSNVSHELSTPLSIITLLCDNLVTLYARLSDEKRRKMIRDIQKHTQILVNLVDEILEISRLDSGAISMKRQAVDLASLIRMEIDKQQPLAQQKHLVLQIIADQPLVIRANEGQMVQVLRNLLSNAIKYTPEGGHITCECRALNHTVGLLDGWPGSSDLPPGQWAGFRINDTGIGISPENLPHIFERFYRIKSQGDVRGTGLGLSIVRELVELHAGLTVVTSTPGEGSTFAVYLPLSKEKRYE